MASATCALDLAVTSIGLVTSLGLDAATSCASARAGLSRAAPLDAFQLYSDEQGQNIGVVGHAAGVYTRGFQGFGLLARLGSGALADLLRGVTMSADDWAGTALCISVSSGYFEREAARLPGADGESASASKDRLQSVLDSLLSHICRLNGVDLPASSQFLFAGDESSFCHALLKAQQLLSNGEFERCIVGGIDATTDGLTMAAAHAFHVLKTPLQAAGYQPGEAAALLLVEPPSLAASSGHTVWARLTGAAVSSEQATRIGKEPALGIGLSAVITACLEVLPGQGRDIGWMLGDLNGDAFRANDWGYAMVRMKPVHPALVDCPLTLPSESFGQIGAAAGPTAVCMAVRAFERGYAPAPAALAWLSSYGGGRGAFAIRKES